jgi:hypothetical protein
MFGGLFVSDGDRLRCDVVKIEAFNLSSIVRNFTCEVEWVKAATSISVSKGELK